MIQGLWDQQDEAIIGAKLSNTDTNPYRFEPMGAILYWWVKRKKDKHGKNYHDQHKHFYLLVLPVDGMLGTEAVVVIANLS